jgi:CheY-like chemotaxis protein
MRFARDSQACARRAPTLLLVEDDELLREVLERYTRDLGFDVRAAADGEEAMELVIEEAFRPQVLLLDLRMPTMSGWELLAAFERSDPLAQIPCVVMTGVEKHGLELRRRTSVLRKPFAVSDLRRELSRWSERAGDEASG